MASQGRTTLGSAVAESSVVVARARLATFDASSELTSDAMFDAASDACGRNASLITYWLWTNNSKVEESFELMSDAMFDASAAAVTSHTDQDLEDLFWI